MNKKEARRVAKEQKYLEREETMKNPARTRKLQVDLSPEQRGSSSM